MGFAIQEGIGSASQYQTFQGYSSSASVTELTKGSRLQELDSDAASQMVAIEGHIDGQRKEKDQQC